VAEANQDLISLTADIVSAHVANNNVSTGDVAVLIRNVYEALSTAGAPPAPEAPAQEPAVSIRASVKPDYIVCLEDGKKLKMLKRYLRSNYNMTPEEYRAKWGLPRDYPMVAPDHAEQRRGLAKQIGLGRKPAEIVKLVKTAAKKAASTITKGLEAARAHLGTEKAAAPAPAKRGRKPKAAPVEPAATAAQPTEG
jgi:predicted transcriptional regulator